MTKKKIINPIDAAKEKFIKIWESSWELNTKWLEEIGLKPNIASYRGIMSGAISACLDGRRKIPYDMLEMALCEMCVSEPKHASVAYLSLDEILKDLASARKFKSIMRRISGK